MDDHHPRLRRVYIFFCGGSLGRLRRPGRVPRCTRLRPVKDLKNCTRSWLILVFIVISDFNQAVLGGLGYSGGAIATGWAAALHASYAPELNIKGWSMGGTPANTTAVLQTVDGMPKTRAWTRLLTFFFC